MSTFGKASALSVFSSAINQSSTSTPDFYNNIIKIIKSDEYHEDCNSLKD